MLEGRHINLGYFRSCLAYAANHHKKLVMKITVECTGETSITEFRGNEKRADMHLGGENCAAAFVVTITQLRG